MKKSIVLVVFLMAGFPAQALWHAWNGPGSQNGKCHLTASENTGASDDLKRHMCAKHQVGCDGSSGGQAGGTGGGKYSSDPLLDAAGTLGNAVGEAAGKQLYNALFGPKKAKTTAPSEDWTRQQQELERQREEERLALQAYQAEQERKRLEQEQTDAAKADLLGQMRGLDGAAASAPAMLRPGTPSPEPVRELAFKDYVRREKQAHDAPASLTRKLTKQQEDWCKMNRPLSPVRPIQPIPDDQYNDMVYRYQVRLVEWEHKCVGAAAGWDEPAEDANASGVRRNSMKDHQLSDFKGPGGTDGSAVLKGPKPAGVAPAEKPDAAGIRRNKLPKQLSEFKTVGGTDGSETLQGPKPSTSRTGSGLENDKTESGSGFDGGGPLRIPAEQP